MASNLYTKRGDAGETDLLGGGRVAKADPRVAAMGEVDELNACLGWAQTTGLPESLATPLTRVQAELFEVGASLATPPGGDRAVAGVSADDVKAIETVIDTVDGGLPPLQSFILPGGTPQAAALHVARAVCRRAERACVRLLADGDEVVRVTVIYLNRLSDLLFAMARAANHAAGTPDTPWTPRGRGD